MARTVQNGFTVVELLISIILAVILLGGGYQLYNTAIKSSASSRLRYKANNIAYELLRQHDNDGNSPCVVVPAATLTHTELTQLPNGTAAITITCPMSNQPEINLISVTVNYNDSGAKSVQRSILK